MLVPGPRDIKKKYILCMTISNLLLDNETKPRKQDDAKEHFTQNMNQKKNKKKMGTRRKDKINLRYQA